MCLTPFSKEAISRYYSEDNVEFDGKRVLTLKHNSQRLLRNELWRGQQRGGYNLPAHARQIGPRCSVVPSAPLPDSKNRNDDKGRPRKDVVLFVSLTPCIDSQKSWFRSLMHYTPDALSSLGS
jgi:hypothetical protein